MNKINPEFEKAKFLVTRNVLIFTASGLLLLMILNILTNDDNLLRIIIGFLISSVTLVILLKTKTYLAPASIALIMGYFLNMSSLFTDSNYSNFIDIFWMLNISLFAFFSVGKRIGLIYLYINIISLTIVTILTKYEFLIRIKAQEVSLGLSINFSINVLVCTAAFGYLISQIFIQTERANHKMLQINSELNKQYDEKSIMLKEIHHRVKNNLQVITSLLRLQLYKIDDPESAAPFNESIDRISSMALIHEKMYQGDKVENIDLKEYITDLTARLTNNYSFNLPVDLEVQTTIKTIDLNHIVPFSLILNELVTNSLKHAFKTATEGKISIYLSKSESNHLLFKYRDSGKWVEIKDENSFGLELIEILTEQIGGTYTLNTDDSTEYKFIFSDINIKE